MIEFYNPSDRQDLATAPCSHREGFPIILISVLSTTIGQEPTTLVPNISYFTFRGEFNDLFILQNIETIEFEKNLSGYQAEDKDLKV